MFKRGEAERIAALERQLEEALHWLQFWKKQYFLLIEKEPRVVPSEDPDDRIPDNQ